VRAASKIQKDALLIPQRAVTEVQGGYQVAVVDDENKVSIRAVKVSDRVGTQWIVEEGLKGGERVVVEGGMKVGPGMQVNAKPFVAETKGR
jgi:membrane fusion protein (multidrug efflux system)